MRRLVEVLIALVVGIIVAVLLAPYAHAAAADDQNWGKWEGYDYTFDGEISYSAGYQFYDAGDLDVLASDMGLEQPDDGMIIHTISVMGGEGDGIRIGGSWFWGKDRTTGGMNIAGDSYSRELTTRFQGAGFVIEATPFVANRFNISTSLAIGGGSAKVYLRQDDGTVRWDDVAGSYTGNQVASSINSEIERDFFMLRPAVTGRFFVFEWMAVEATAGYHWDTLSDQGWTFHSTELSGKGPDLDFRKPFFHVGIALGGS